MKRWIGIILAVFALGWALRVMVPYWQSVGSRNERRERREATTLVLNAVYRYAQTNGGKFPNALGDVGTEAVVGIDFKRFVYRKPPDLSGTHIDGTKVILAESAQAFSNEPTLFVGVKGNWVIMKSRAEYEDLMKRNGITE